MDFFVDFFVAATRFIYLFGDLLRCPHKRVVTITKVYIARNNMQVQFIRFHQKYRLYSRLLLRSEGLSDHSVYSIFARWQQLTTTQINNYPFTRWQYDRRTGDNKTKPKNWHGQLARKVGPSDNSVRYSTRYILHSVYDSLDRLATASERTSSYVKVKKVFHTKNRHEISPSNFLFPPQMRSGCQYVFMSADRSWWKETLSLAIGRLPEQNCELVNTIFS